LEKIETAIRQALPNVIVFTHLESLEDPCSWKDTALDRMETAPVDTLQESAAGKAEDQIKSKNVL